MTRMFSFSLIFAVICLAFIGHFFAPSQALTVHLVPHTHDDVGWLKTVDQYFEGTARQFQHAAVTHVLTSVMAALKRVPERKFVYVEQAYFQRWWRQQNDEMKNLVKSLLANGQLEFINGGWCMHDEATTHVIDMIDQTTLGHQYILREFGEAANPIVGWQIDCFGHSSTQAAVLSYQAGFDATFFGRIDYQDHNRRVAEKKMQTLWRPSQSLGPDYQVWAEIALDGNYNPPPGFCWDNLCQNDRDDPFVQDDPRLEDLNVAKRVDDFIKQAYDYAKTRQGDIETMNIQWNMGSDFNYENAEQYFINLDKIIKAVNLNGTITAQYSTPSLYYKAKLAEKQTWPVKTDDFFPLVDDPANVWSGYFSSRPGLKGYVRSTSKLLQTARQIDLFSGGTGEQLELLWEALGVAQHHDAVSGTELQHVAYDYIKRLAIGEAATYDAINTGFTKIINNGAQFTACPLINISICSPIQNANKGFSVALWNSEARNISQLIQLPIYSSTNVMVKDSDGNTIESELTRGVGNSAWTSKSADNLISFIAQLPPLGYRVYEISVAQTPKILKNIKPSAVKEPQTSKLQTFDISNNYVILTFNNDSGLIESWTDKISGKVHQFSQNFYYYQSSTDTNFASTSNYMLGIQKGTEIAPITTMAPKLTIVQNNLFTSVIQRWNNWLVQEIRIEAQADSPYVDFDWVVGPVNVDDGVSKEIVTRYETDIASGETFYTDSNGLELQKRILNYRPSFNWTTIKPIQANYYPATAIAAINDDDSGLYVLIDRAEGASSQSSGNLEFLIHRRTLCPCGFQENLNETDSVIYQGTTPVRLGRGLIIKGKHRVVLAAKSQAIDTARIQQQSLYRPILPVFSSASSTSSKSSESESSLSLSFAQSSLPVNIELQTLQVLVDGSVLLRLSHSFAVNESSSGLSDPVTFDLSTLFVQPLKSITQMTLTANAKYQNRQSRSANKAQCEIQLNSQQEKQAKLMDENLKDGSIVTIYPMQILTFTLTF